MGFWSEQTSMTFGDLERSMRSRSKQCPHRRDSTLGQRGQLPPFPNIGFAPKCYINQCLTNSKHRRIGAKRSVLWLSKYAEMCFCISALLRPQSRRSPVTLNSCEGTTSPLLVPSPISPNSVPSAPRFGVLPVKYFSENRTCSMQRIRWHIALLCLAEEYFKSWNRV